MELPRIGSRGQQFTVLQLLQGAVIAMAMLLIVYGVVQYTKDQAPTSDVYSVTCEVLSSAFAARGTGEHFNREAMLTSQEVSATSLVQCSGLPIGTTVGMHCTKPFCLVAGEPADCGQHTPCPEIEFAAGQTIPVCAICDEDECRVWFGEKEC